MYKVHIWKTVHLGINKGNKISNWDSHVLSALKAIAESLLCMACEHTARRHASVSKMKYANLSHSAQKSLGLQPDLQYTIQWQRVLHIHCY